MDARGHTSVDVSITTTDGRVHDRGLDIAPGFPGNDLTDAQQLGRFHDCMAYAATPLSATQVAAFLEGVDDMASLRDARSLMDTLVATQAAPIAAR
jgi:hypothetical protein